MKLGKEQIKMRFNVNKFFFTPTGAAVLIISLVILIRALLARNAYEIVLSCAALLLLLVLGIIGANSARKLSEMKPGWKPPYPFTAGSGELSVISGLETNIPLFFRLHFEVMGSFFTCGEKYNFKHESIQTKTNKRNLWINSSCVFEWFVVKNEVSVPRGENNAKLDMDFPMSGIFQGEGICKLRDVFGFFSFKCGEPLHRAFNIRPSPCFGKDYFINAQSGAEDKRNKHSPDEERYYMREYAPGDRFRDINWKSSEKIDALITRISPDNQEKVSRIEVYFRNFGNMRTKGSQKPSLEELWLLDRAKARLSHFLRSLREKQASFIFDVRAAGRLENWEIEDEEDLDVFLEELAGIGFVPPQNETAVNSKSGELYVFSTACDLGLQSFLTASQPRPVSLFIINHEPHEQSRTKELEILYKRDFLLKGVFPNPRRLIRGKIKPMSVHAPKTEIIYAGTRL